MKEKIVAIIVATFIVDLLDHCYVNFSEIQGGCKETNVPDYGCHHPDKRIREHHRTVILAEAKGVAGLGKAGGDGQGGSDKAGQQVPPEVYMALTYAGSLFLLTLSAPVILYGLNKLLNKILDCFGCGPSNKKAPVLTTTTTTNNNNTNNKNISQQKGQLQQQEIQSISKDVSQSLPGPTSPLDQSHQNQLLHQLMMQQQYSKHHPSHAFTLSNSNGSLATNNFVNNTSHHGTPPPANNNVGAPNSCAINLPFDNINDSNYKNMVGTNTTSSSSAASQHRKEPNNSARQTYISPTSRI